MILLILILSLSAAFGAVDYTGHKVYRVLPETAPHLSWLNQLQKKSEQTQTFDFWKEPTLPHQHVDIMVEPSRTKLLETSLTRLRMKHDILVDDVQSLINLERPKNPDVGLGTFDDYMDFDTIQTWMDTRVSECGTRCEKFFVGNSYEGRELWGIKITDGSGDLTKRGLWIDGGIHCREWLAISTPLYIIDRLIDEFGSVQDVDNILGLYDVYVLPLINADGYVYTWGPNRMWRKSRQPNAGSTCVGTDINRNFDFMWMTIGASDDPCSNTHAGPEPYSEPEAQAVADFIMAREGTWDLFLTLHTYGLLWMAPFGYTYDLPADYDELMRVANAGAAALQAIHGTVFETGTASQILYPSSGTSRDWARGVANISYVFTMELRDEDSFILPPTEIRPTGEEVWAGFKAMMDAIIFAPKQ